jgi:hypothetical protein
MKKQTVFQRGYHRYQRGIESIPVAVDASGVNI